MPVEAATAIAVSAATTITPTTTTTTTTKTATKTRRERKRTTSFFLSSCFRGSSSVSFSDELQSSGRIKKKKKEKRKAPWLSWWRVQKKKEKKKMIPFESSNTTVAAAASSPASSSKVLLKKCFHKNPIARARDNENDSNADRTNTTAPQLREDVAADSPPRPQPPLPSTSTKPSAAQTSHSPDPIQTGISADQPRPPRRCVHRTAQNRGPARTSSAEPLAGLWVMATVLGVMVFFGRAGAVVFLCSCMYIMPAVRATTAGDSGVSGDRSDEKGVDLDSEKYKKRVIMEGLLERNGRRPSYAL